MEYRRQETGVRSQEKKGKSHGLNEIRAIDLAFTAAALALEPNAVSPPVKGMKGCYLIQLTQKSYPDSSAFLQQRDEIRNKLLTTKQNEVYTEWLEAAKKKAKLQDFRYLYYRDY